MKDLPALLKDADPLGDERPRADHERRALRNAILDAPASRQNAPSRRSLVVTAGVLALAALAGGFGIWSRGSVDVVAAVRFEVRLAEDSPAPSLREVTISGGRRIYLHPEVVISNADIAHAEVAGGDGGPFGVSFTLTAEGAAKMQRATEGHIGRPLAILLDGEVAVAPVVRAAITTAGSLTGRYTRAEAERIAAGILGR